MTDHGSIRLWRRPTLFISTAAVAVLAIVLGAGAFVQRASSQPASTSIRACVNIYTGQFRILHFGTCSIGEYLIEWNGTGPEGPQGPQGEQGPPGPPTFLDTYFVSERHAIDTGDGGDDGDGGDGGNGGRLVAPILSGPFLASCNPGDFVVTGGYELIADGDSLVPPIVLATRPFLQPGGGGGDDGGGSSDPTESWLISVQHDSGLQAVDVWALCNVAGGG